MWVQAPLFPLVYHFRESLYRISYWFISFFFSCIIFYLYLPSLFMFSPFFFLHTSWDDAFVSLLRIASLYSFFWTAPFLLFQIYSWFTPGLLPKENRDLKNLMLWLGVIISLYLIFAPMLLWSVPAFFLTFHSSVFYFTPSLSFLANLVWDFSFSFLFISLCMPLSIYFRVSRAALYTILVLYSVVLEDFWSMLLMLLPLVLTYEITYFIYIWLGKRKEASSREEKGSQ